jgi:hypothetical protein
MTSLARRLGLSSPDGHSRLVGKAASALASPKGGVLVATSAIAAAAWNELEHRRIARADLDAAPVRIVRLGELKDDASALSVIEDGLRREWGEFAFLGFDTLRDLASSAGRLVLVALVDDGEGFVPRAALQTTFADCAGDPGRLRDELPSFRDLTAARALKRAAKRGGDTVVCLQITVFGADDRGLGLGSLLRDAGLNLLDEEVRYALTTTPIDLAPAQPALDLEDKSTFTASMRFHARGGAVPVMVLPAFKRADEPADNKHGSDIVIMRYTRDAEGNWPVAMPAMHFRRVGPLQARLESTARRVKHLPVRLVHRAG